MMHGDRYFRGYQMACSHNRPATKWSSGWRLALLLVGAGLVFALLMLGASYGTAQA